MTMVNIVVIQIVRTRNGMSFTCFCIYLFYKCIILYLENYHNLFSTETKLVGYMVYTMIMCIFFKF